MSIVERERTVTSPERQCTVTRRDVLHRAADLIEEFGWTCGTKGDPDSACFAKEPIPLCILGALARARFDFGERFDWESEQDDIYDWAAEPLVGTWAGVFPDGEPGHIYRWNDDLFNAKGYEAKSIVVAKLREAAERA